LNTDQSAARSFYFTTRDLLIMAVLAALGGVTSTYINAVGNAVHAALGFPGATQWAAGLHTLWIVLAMGILRKTGAGTLMGIIKGSVELMSGNTHGVIILLINLVAGLLVDFGFLLFREKRSSAPYLVAGGLAAGSNVIIFQLFATLPANILAMGAILLLSIVAAISGIIFSGFAPFFLVNALIKADVVKIPEKTNPKRKIGWFILSGVFVLAILLTVYLRTTLRGSPTIKIYGAVENPYEFPSQNFTPDRVTRQMPYRGIQTQYTGYPLLDLVEFAQPLPGADTLLIEASDGYAFLISFNELNTNPNILAVQQGQGQNASFDIVGPLSSKAWVRNVIEMSISISQGLVIQSSTGETFIFYPDEWLSEMDSTQIALPDGSQKLQGVPLWKVIDSFILHEGQIVVHVKSDQDVRSYSWDEINIDDNMRIFTVIKDEGFKYALGTMSGDVYLYPITGIEVE
jgi:energy-coupling factor transport system permease protein